MSPYVNTDTARTGYIPPAEAGVDGIAAKPSRTLGGTALDQPDLVLVEEQDNARSSGETSTLAGDRKPGAKASKPVLAPALETVSVLFSIDRVVALISFLQFSTCNTEAKSAGQRIDQMSKQNSTLAAKRSEFAEQRLEMVVEAGKSSSSTLDWILKGVGLAVAGIGFALLIAATGGAATPLVVLAGVGLLGALVDTASDVSMAAGGPSLNPAQALAQGGAALLELFGVSSEDAEAGGKIISLVTVVISPQAAGNFASGVAQLSGADENTQAIASSVATVVTQIGLSITTVVASGGAGAVSAAAKFGSMTQFVLKGANIALQSLAAAGKITQGGLGIAAASYEYLAADLMADGLETEASMKATQREADTAVGTYERNLNAFQMYFEQLASAVTANARSMTSIFAIQRA